MASAVVITIVCIFIAGVAAGVLAVVSMGIHREEGRTRKEHDLFMATGQMPEDYLSESPPDGLSRGTRRMTGYYVQRDPPVQFDLRDSELLV
jgi:hypothetical protein